MKSIWETNLSLSEKKYKALERDVYRDIVVIGGGIAGILTAYHLSKEGFKVTLLEADRLYSGVTSKTTAHITAQQGSVYYDLAKSKSPEWAKLYYESQQKAIDDFENLIQTENIDCDFKRVSDYNYTLADLKNLKKLYKILSEINPNVQFSENRNILGFKVQGVIETPNQAMFHPLKFLIQLKKPFEIFENTRVVDMNMDKKIIYTKNNKIYANKIIIATNYPIVKLKGAYYIKLYKSNSYCAATQRTYDIEGTYHSDMENGWTLRSYNKQIIIGGLDHRTGRIDQLNKKDRLKEISGKYFNADIANFWEANDVMTYDTVPIVGRFSEKYKDVYIITGFNKWGMSNSMVSSKLITDLIMERENKFEKIFSPQRANFDFIAFLTNFGVSLNNLLIRPLMPAFKSYKKLKPGEGKIVFFKGTKKAVYKDEDNKLHICSPYCKHLGCQLRFNKNSKTWDCPCHGSRYDIDGEIITAPTVEELNKIKP